MNSLLQVIIGSNFCDFVLRVPTTSLSNWQQMRMTGFFSSGNSNRFISSLQGGDLLQVQRNWGLDIAVILIFLLGTVAFGLWISRRQEGLEDYFLGGRRIPWGAALLSMVATEISAATFLGAPEQGYLRDMTYLQIVLGSLFARVVLAFVFLGIFYKLRVFTVYGFLTTRFGIPTKNTAAGAFLLGRVFAAGSRLFIASLAVKVVTGMDFLYSIILLGIIAILYTLFGGIKAVIWTDVIQAIILVLGALVCIVILLGDIGMTSSELIDFLNRHEKFRMFDPSIGVDGRAWLSNPYQLWPALIGGFFLTMATHGTDQSMVQRLLTCKDRWRGQLSLIWSGVLGFIVAAVFIFIGMLLFVLIQTRPEGDALVQLAADLKASGQNGDLFLHYILNRIPSGFAGLIIASVLASAMSSIDSELNAMSSTFVNDFYRPYFAKTADPNKLMQVAKLWTLIFGAILIAVAVAITEFYLSNPETDLLTIALGIMTLFYGGLLGVFLVGLLTRGRGNSYCNIVGMTLSLLTIGFLTNKQGLLKLLGLVDPLQPKGFWGSVYEVQLAWPWFIVLGTAITVAIALAGRTALALGERDPNGTS